MLQTCKKYGNVLRAPEMLAKRNTLIWDLKDNLIYCRIAKVSLKPTCPPRIVRKLIYCGGGRTLRLRLQAINPSGEKGRLPRFCAAKKARDSNQ